MQPCISPENDHWTCTSPTTPHHTPHLKANAELQSERNDATHLKPFCELFAPLLSTRELSARKQEKPPECRLSRIPRTHFYDFSSFLCSDRAIFAFFISWNVQLCAHVIGGVLFNFDSIIFAFVNLKRFVFHPIWLEFVTFDTLK